MPVIKGTAQNDTLDGTEDTDLIQGLGGDGDTILEIDPDGSFAPFQSETTILFENVSMSGLTTHNLGGHAPGGSAVPGISLRGKPAEIVSANEEWIRPDALHVATPARSEFGTVVTGLFAETDPFQVNTVTAGSQGEPVIASLASGGFVVAWMSGQSVKVQVFDRHGDKVGGEFLADASNNGNPAVLGLASGGFVVGWSDFVSGEVGIWARMFDSAGNPVGGSFEVSSGTSTGNPTQPSFAALSSGGFVASWTDQDVPFSSSGIKAQIFDAAGAKVGGEFAVNTTTAMEQYFSLTGGLPGGGFVATWVDQLNGFRGQIFNASGSTVGAEFAVGASDGSYNALTVLSSGNFIVALVDGNGDISGQIFSPAGAPVGGAFMLNTVTDNNHDMPTLTALPDGGFVASWREATGTTPNFFEDGEIKAQVFDANGVKIGVEFMVNVGTSGGQMIPKVVAVGSGDFTIVWVDFQSSESEIKARTYFSVDLGTNGDDSFVGTADRDFYQGLDGNDQVSGGSEDDSLDGGGGDDVLDGGDGADRMEGGAGNDFLFVDNVGDVVIEEVGGGTDTIYSSVSYVLAAGQHVENLSTISHGSTAAINLTGNSFNNNIVGNAGANILESGGGEDVITGLGGNDVLIGGADNDVIYGNEGDDYAFGGAGDDQIDGGDGGDILEGGTGSDQLHGGIGNDTLNESQGGESDGLYGEDGDDRLHYNAVDTLSPLSALLDGGSGDDQLDYFSFTPGVVRPHQASLFGGDGSDRITASGGSQIGIDAGGGADFVEITHYLTGYEIALGAGSDLLSIVSNQFFPTGGAAILVSDFAAGDGGDSLSFVSYLAWQTGGWSFADNPFATGHLQLVQQGADAVLRFDRDGAAGSGSAVDFIVLENVAMAALTARNLGGYAAGGGATAGAAIVGDETPDMLSATSGDDLVYGLGGNDVLRGGAGNDRLEGGEGDDRLDGELGDDLIYGGAGNDTLDDRLAGNDQMFGEGGNDNMYVDRQWFAEPASNTLMDGGADADQMNFIGRALIDDVTMLGGGGNDLIRASRAQNVVIDAGEGNDFVDLDLGIGNAQVTLGAGADALALNLGSGTVVGFTVTDFETGDAGDRFYLLPLLPGLLTSWNPATNPFATNHLRLAQRGADTLLLYDAAGVGQDFKLLGQLTNVDAADLTQFNLDGHAPVGPIAFAGTDGADTLTGTAGANELIGFAGNDTYFVDAAGDQVIEVAGGGTDTIYSSVSYVLAAGQHVENLSTISHGSTAAINLTGNSFNNTLIGNAGANILNGGGGTDTLQGLGGNDTYFVDSADRVIEAAGGGTDTVYSSVSYTLAAGQHVEILSTISHGSTAAINLTGNSFNNTLVGNAGVNVLNGGGGADNLQGLGGNDIYYIYDALARISEQAGGGSDTVYSNVSYTLNGGAHVELLSTLSHGSTAAINLTGNSFNNHLVGNAGANILNGGGGNDTLQGLGGNDTYFINVASVQVLEGAGGGADLVYSSVSYTLGAAAQVETLSTVSHGAVNAINLTGNAFNNTIIGNAGANVLDGKGGNDTLQALGGADTFAFTTALGAGNVDLILNYSVADDTIWLDDAVFTGLGLGALNANAFVTGPAAADADDRIIYNSATGALLFDADGNGAGGAIQFASIGTGLSLTAGDFAVI